MKNRSITVQGSDVSIATWHELDYISLTDMLKKFGDDSILYNWLRNRNTIEFLGIWEQLYNPNFKPIEFDRFRSQAGLKTSGLGDVLRAALAQHAQAISAAFVYGSVAKKQDAAGSDIDLMVISDSLNYADLFASLEDASKRLGRPLNLTVYSKQDLKKRIKQGNAFVTRVLAQPKLWLIGGEDEFRA